MAWNVLRNWVLKICSCVRCLGGKKGTAGSAGTRGSRGLRDKLAR